jgi:hypothetical protein
MLNKLIVIGVCAQTFLHKKTRTHGCQINVNVGNIRCSVQAHYEEIEGVPIKFLGE